MISKNKKINSFVEYTKSETKKANIKCVLANVKYLVIKEEGYVRCNGYFDEKNMLLKCAINKPITEWLPIFVHEFSHFEQWRGQCETWKKCFFAGEDKTSEIIEWVKGKEVKKGPLKKYYKALKYLELDCEKRTVKNIRKFELPIDLDDYARKANAYVLFHDYIYFYRKWYKVGRVPYDNKNIIATMPNKIVPKGRVATKKQLELYDKFCS